jgi:bifunctional DNA-binding transcriptional regulator/antitoxin component of YhaV-PrlF toxin-antitoxin module
MIKVVKITSNGTKQLLLYVPTAFKDAFHLKKGDYLIFYIEGRKLILEPLNKLIDLKGEGGSAPSHLQEPASADLKTEVSEHR